MFKQILIASVALTPMFFTTGVMAISDATKVGANAGAMSYCREKFADGDTEAKYDLLKLKTLGEFDDLDGSDKTKALVMKKAAEDGEYLGDPLSRGRCDSLRKMLYLKYN